MTAGNITMSPKKNTVLSSYCNYACGLQLLIMITEPDKTK